MSSLPSKESALRPRRWWNLEMLDLYQTESRMRGSQMDP